MDNEQKQILGNLLLQLLVAVGIYLSGQLQLWFSNPALLALLGMIIAALVYAGRKWIKYSFGLPDDIEEEVTEDVPEETEP